ncbi:hypothetical protein [Streptomyces erythrochromogenes]|uniref:hypothetical protein n=1 Tax=Streptomyces erythrochromogenes TaxID=285574 RepID=UPI00386ABA72|nr:hypothetical protein OG364_00850 [Streptomyces erythrochromogenes]WST98378.1 hypothetical protein OG364_40685 [Streptomyces erythrochromogenes]
MHRLRRLRLVNIGHAAAGFKSLVLDLTGGVSHVDGRVMPAVDVILWLRNGGGKSSLLSLIFSLFLPAKGDFIGHKKGKSLADYVPDQKVSHVIAEWEDTSLPRGGPALVTGGVYQWQDGHRPADVDTGWELLVRRWYAFRPLPGLLDLDCLPVRTESGQLTQSAFLKKLADAGKTQRGLHLRIAKDQTEWRTLLSDLRLDPAVMRIQRDMNREEGGITELFQFSTCEDFVDFLIDLVCDQRDPSVVRASLEETAAKLARRPGREREQSFLAAALLALKPVTAHSALAAVQQEVLAQQVWGALRAAEHLSERAQALESTAAAAAAQATAEQAAEAKARRHAAREERRLVVLNRHAAQWAADDAGTELQRCEEKAANAQLAHQAWELVDTVLELDAQRQEEQRLRALLERQDVRQAPLREAMQTAGATLRDRLSSADEELAGEVARARQESNEAAAERQVAEDGHRQAAKAQWQAKDRLRRASEQLAAAEEAVETARRDGLIGARENPGDARTRYADEHTDVSQRLQDHRARQAASMSRLSGLAEQQAACAVQLAAVQERHSAQWDRLSSFQADRRELASDRRLLELACAEPGTVLDLDQVAGDLLNLLAAAGQQSDALMLQEQVDGVDDRRAVKALQDVGFLPAPMEVERAVDRLRELGAPAVSGLQFLREVFRADEHAAVVAAVPHLIGGVVVCGALPEGEDLATLAQRAGVTASVIAVGEDHQARQAIATAAGTVVLPVHPGLLKPDAAEREQLRLEHRLEGLEGRVRDLVRRRETDAALARRLQAHMDVFGAGPREGLEAAVARLEHEADTLHDKHRLLKEQARRAHEDADALGPAIDALTERLVTLTDLLHRVRELAQAHERVMPACRAEREQARQAVPVHKADMRRYVQAREGAEARREAARDLLRRLEERQRRHDSEIKRLDADLPAGCGHALSAAELAATAVETLRSRFDQARRDWEGEIGDAGLRARVEGCAKRITEITRTLGARPGEVCAKAEQLARSPHAGEEEDRSRKRAEAEAAKETAIERRGVSKEAKLRADTAWEEASAAVEALDPAYDAHADQAGPFDTAAGAFKAQAEVRRSVDRAHTAAQEHQLKVRDLHIATEKAKSAAHRVARCVQGVKDRAGRHRDTVHDTAPDVGAVQLDAQLFSLVEQLQISASSLASLSPEQAEALEETVTGAVDTAAKAHDDARKKLEKSVRKVHSLTQDQTHRDVVEGQLLERLLNDLNHPARLAELIEEIDLREKVVLGELAELAEDQLMVVQTCLALVKTVLDDVQQVAHHSRLPQGLGSWSGQQFLSLEIRHLPDDEVLARRLSTEIDRMTAAVAGSTAAKATALPEAMTLTKELVLAALGGRGNVVAKIIKPTQSLDTVQRNSVTQIRKFSGGELLTVSVLLYCTLARLRAAKQGRKASGGVGTLVLDNPFGKANYAPFIGLQRKVAAAHGIQLVYTTGSNDLPALERFPLIIRLRNGIDARTRSQYVQIADRYGDALSRGMQHAYDDGITSARLHRHSAQDTGPEDTGSGIPHQSGETETGDAGSDE